MAWFFMSSFSLLLSNFSSVYAASIFSSKFSNSVTSLIVNGSPLLSRSRPFYARIKLSKDTNGQFCGGVVIHQMWVMTAARCMINIDQDSDLLASVIVELGDFTQSLPAARSGRFHIQNVFFAPGYNATLNYNNVALVQLRKPTPKYRVADLCNQSVYHGTPLATCGLGSTSGFEISPAPSLREISFTNSIFQTGASFPFVERCPNNMICNWPDESNANICFMDEGSPLYTYNRLPCSNNRVEVGCVLGIASHYRQHKYELPSNCRGGSHFTSVPYLYNWIEDVVSGRRDQNDNLSSTNR